MTTTTTIERSRPAPRPIGFIDHDRARAASQAQGAQTRLQAKAQQQPENPDTLLHFDGGETVSFLDASHNVLVLGTTGSGKTASVIAPALNALCAAGYGGVVIDSKGSLSPIVRAIAARHGRETDVVEAGPYEDSVPFNLLAGRTAGEARDILEPLLLGFCSSDREGVFWHRTGLQQFMDAYAVAQDLCRRIGETFGLHMPVRMLQEPAFALKVFTRWKAGLRPDDRAGQDLLARIEASSAHIVPKTAKIMESKVWQEQTTYYGSAVRTGLGLLQQTPGILPRFFAPDGQAFNAERLVFDEGRILVLRLSPDSGEAGAGLARILLRDFYGAVFRRGLGLPDGRYVFCVADEWQDYLSTSSLDALNDAAVIAKCREFACIFVAGTQSAIALSQRAAHGLDDVRAMAVNFNNRIFLYNDDPETLRLAGSVAEHVRLHELEPGECLLVRYDAGTRRHDAGVTSANGMYATMAPVRASAVRSQDRLAVADPDAAKKEQESQKVLAGQGAVGLPHGVPAPASAAQDEIVEETPLESALASVRHRGMDLAHVPEALRTPEVCLAAVHQDGMALRYVPEALKTLEICMEAVRQDGLMLARVPASLRTPELCMEAVMQAGQALEFVPETLKTEELCLEAMMQDGMALAFVPEALKTPALYLEAVQSNGRALQYVPAWLRTQDLCLAAVRNDGVALEWVPARLRTPEMCMEAVHSSGWALQFVPPALKTMELCLVAVRRSPRAATLLPDVLASDAVSAQRPRAGARAGRSGGPRLAGIPCRPRRRHGGIPCR